jgi:hypothetical protein
MVEVFNMSATMARQWGRVKLEQCDLHLALNMGKMAKRWVSPTAREDSQYVIKNPHTEVPEEKKQGVEFPGNNQVKTEMERHLAMIHQNHMAGCHLSPNGAAKNPKTCSRCQGTAVPSPN